ncbi:MAG: hypothetical protein AcusKO_43000 [Acuticoccus sp.]
MLAFHRAAAADAVGLEADVAAIGILARRTGTKVQTIGYYEQSGLRPKFKGTEGTQRRYCEANLDRLSFIRRARQLGFSLDAIRELLDLSDQPNRPRHES